MPSDPLISDILSDLATTWGAISVANGDHTDVDAVFLLNENPVCAADARFVNIEELVEDKTLRPQKEKIVTAQVTIGFYVPNDLDDPRNDILRLGMDLERRAEETYQRGGSATNTVMVHSEYPPLDESAKRAEGRHTYQIRYGHAWQDPSASRPA